MKCLKCGCESDSEVCGVCRVQLITSGETPAQAHERITLDQNEQAKVLLGELVKLVVGKHPNVSLNALGTLAGVILGQIDNPVVRHRVHEKFELLVSEQSKLYTSKHIRAQFEAREKQAKN